MATQTSLLQAALASGKRPSKQTYRNLLPTSPLRNDQQETTNTEDGDSVMVRHSEPQHAGEAEEMSIDDAIDKLGMGFFQYRILVASGLCFAADAMEVLLLSFLSIVLRDQWGLSDDESAFITSILFAGALVGTSILGPLADKWGRRPVFLLSAAIISVFGLGTSLCQNYLSVLIIMGCIGFGVGGLVVPFDTLAEFLPSEGRGTNLLLIEYFWTLGCLLVIVFAELTLAHGKLNWRLFVSLCSLPCFASLVIGYFFVPESVRWLVSVGRRDEALEILRNAAHTNYRASQTFGGFLSTADNIDSEEDIDILFPSNLILTSDEDHSGENSASLRDLLKPEWRGIILRLWGAWGGFAFGYYGSILAITKVFEDSETTTISSHPNLSSPSNSTITDMYKTSVTDDFDYSAIFISSSAELVGTTMVILLVDRVGRIPSQTVCYVAAGLCVCLLCTLSSAEQKSDNNDGRWMLIGLGFITRALEMGATCVTWVSTAEILTTEVRAAGHSSANAMARMGAFFSPFLVDGHSMSLQTIGVIMLFVHWFTAACVVQLPETKGAQMGGGHGLQALGMGNEETDGLYLTASDVDGDLEDDGPDNDADRPEIHVSSDYKHSIANMELT